MKKTVENVNETTYIYIATTEQLRKRNIFKVGYADDVVRRMSELHGYASFKKDKWYVVYTYEVLKKAGKKPDHEFHVWYEKKYNVKLMSVDEIRIALNLASDKDVHEKELYHGISTDSDVSAAELASKVKEFFGIDPTVKKIGTDWCIPSSRTPYSISNRMIEKLEEANARCFDFLANPNLKICDFACKDPSFVNALLDKMFMYNIKSRKCVKSLITDILTEHIFAYCLDSEYNNIIAGIKSHISCNPKIYGKIDGNKLDDKIFQNFTVEYMEEYSKETMNNKLDMLSHCRRFDAVVMNPPYSTTGGGNLHLDFTKAALEIADNVVSLFPFSFVKRMGIQYDKYNSVFDDRLISVEEISSKMFAGTNMQNIGVYNFIPYNDSVITITDITGSSKIVKSLNDLSVGNKEESELFNAVKSAGSVERVSLLRDERNIRKLNPDLSINEARLIKSKEIANRLSAKFNDKVCLIVTATSGTNDKLDGRLILSSSGQICDTAESLKMMLLNATARDYRGIFVNTVKAAKNLKAACERTLIRFLIFRMQKDRCIVIQTLGVIPNIDWSDPKAKTDQGILELCGMTPDRAKYWADYCVDKIYQIDHGKRV